MKKIFIYMASAALAATMVSGCMEPGRPINFDVRTGDELYLPADNSGFDLSSVADVEFYWAPSVAADNGYVTYEVLFDKEGGDFSKPLVSFPSQITGSSPNVVLTAKSLNTVAKAAGLLPGTSGKVIWTVRAGKGIGGTIYKNYRTMTLTPMNSMDPLPANVWIKGAGAEDAAGIAMVPSVPVDGVAAPAGVFECFTKIKGGTEFTVTDELDRQYVLAEGGSLSNVETATGSTFDAEAIYWIKIDFDGMLWSAVPVSDVVLYAAAWTGGTMKTANTPMTYKGKGVWELLDYANTNSDNPEKDSRHRFNISLGNGTTLYAGGSTPLGTDYTQAFLNVDFYTVDGVGNKDWDKTWTFLAGDCGRPFDCTLYLNADNPAGRYWHEYKFK